METGRLTPFEQKLFAHCKKGERNCVSCIEHTNTTRQANTKSPKVTENPMQTYRVRKMICGRAIGAWVRMREGLAIPHSR